MTEAVKAGRRDPGGASLFLAETPEWQEKYAAGTFKAKRLAAYAEMKGFAKA